MKGKIISNFDIRVYSLEGKLMKAFYNVTEADAEHLYAYYTADDDMVVKVEPADTFYNLLEIKEDKRRR